MAEELKANQRKEWAKLMYLKENITQQEIACLLYTSDAGLLDWLRQQDLERAKELSDYFDAYIKEKMKWVK